MQVTVHALTRANNGIARVIESPIDIYNTLTNQKESTKAIWDTGATGSAITKSLVQKLALIPVTKTNVKGVHGVKTGVPVYAVKIVLNNQNVSFTLPVTECEELSDDASAGFLLGMDIITKGDFAISNVNGQTVMTFRVPSIERFDFVKDLDIHRQQKKNISRKEEIKNLYKAKKK
ncbi:retropepsin-like domain-containing protein [Fulvivirgaceae bacterium PWU4]|uniref:Retropepsin-like domain-containing protein n=1 Tax=Chryseosolibacter histidini TaxID=2782349 RepID=A0AAP2DNS8_9BACT|nr:aspartyl protease family protein [Chryseosolibacter histidini]MBT1698262.1 retropepsin-like domain-containing protein [Chryseosolibacter histidini]